MKVLISFLVASFLSSGLLAHSVGEAAGLRFVYGSSPEPAITDELLAMQWIVMDLASGQPAENLTDLSVTMEMGGKSWGPFEPEAVYGEKGLFTTSHLFAKPGTYKATLAFKLAGSDEQHEITLEAHLMDRADIVID